MMTNKFLNTITIRLYTFLAFLMLAPGIGYAQYQENIPKPSGPVDLSETSNQIIFIVIPVVILILYLVFRRRIKRIKEEKRRDS